MEKPKSLIDTLTTTISNAPERKLTSAGPKTKKKDSIKTEDAGRGKRVNTMRGPRKQAIPIECDDINFGETSILSDQLTS